MEAICLALPVAAAFLTAGGVIMYGQDPDNPPRFRWGEFLIICGGTVLAGLCIYLFIALLRFLS